MKELRLSVLFQASSTVSDAEYLFSYSYMGKYLENCPVMTAKNQYRVTKGATLLTCKTHT